MRSTTIIAAVSLGIALAGCGKKNDAVNNDANLATDLNATANGSEITMNGAGATVAAMPAQQFTDTIAGSDMFEIQTGKLAQTKATNPDLKKFGSMLVTDHTKSTSMLKTAAAKTSPVVALPMVLPADLKAKVTALKAASGAEFDRLFVEQQIAGHQTALSALQGYSSGGDQPSLKEFATTATPVVQGHLTQLQAMPR